ncbi:RNA helicase [Gracilaria domingensis]|nr:RNA helicase [Gracilaria domingensis]
MGGSKRSRSGRRRVNPGVNKVSGRQREEAEIARVEQSLKDIPRYSDRFQLFRVNRRQRAKQILAESEKEKEAPLEHQIFKSTSFTEFPLSSRTLDGLAAANFTELTGIQRTAIPQALAGRDILAAAPTGSGKTLAFLVPALEALWRKKWNTMDGLGALILSPTRELGIQIFEVLRSIGRQHTVSAGLVIGGKDFEGEREKVAHMNVLVATPGRLLHHMDHVAELDCSNLQVLILDEADRILDMGFAKTLDAILANLPKDRQTMLFSATQTKNVKALARLSLKNPEYVAISSGLNQATENDEKDKQEREEDDSNVVKIVGTPQGLTQTYAVVPAHDKLSVLWSFIKTHLKSKMIVFLATGKQVRFVFETFCKLRPGMSLLHIHGNMKQLKRTDMYDLFCRTKSAVLFATDVASRGLDFPDVEWVVQVDCPDDVGTYVHRVGRTARFRAQGRAMLFISEGSEETFLKRLEAKNVPLRHTKLNPQRITDITPRISATVATNQELKKLAQRAFMFYLKSVYQQSDKQVFNVTKVDYEKLAKSYGLSNVPTVSIRSEPADQQHRKQKSTTVFGYRVVARKKAEQRDETPMKGSDNDENNDLLTIRKGGSDGIPDGIDGPNGPNPTPRDEIGRRKRKKRKLDLVGNLPSANRIVFTEEGQAVRAGDIMDTSSDEEANVVEHDGIDDYAASVSRRLKKAAAEDKKTEQERVQSLHSCRKAKERGRNKLISDRPGDSIINSDSSEGEQDGYLGSDYKDPNDSDSGQSSTSDEMKGQDSTKADEMKALMILQARSKETRT